jgi:hypothetical protein
LTSDDDDDDDDDDRVHRCNCLEGYGDLYVDDDDDDDYDDDDDCYCIP